MKKKAPLIFIFCYFAYTTIYIARINLSAAAPALQEMQLITDVEYGILGSVFSVIYALGRLISGNMGDKKPPVVLICSGLVLSGISNLCIGFLPPFAGLVFLWGTNALAQSMLWSAVLCVLSAIYDAPTAKKRTSVLVTAVATGNILGILLPAYLIDGFGARWAFIVPGLFTLIAATGVFFAIRSIPAPCVSAKQQKNLLQLMKNPALRIALIPTFLHGVIKDNITLWMMVFLIDRFGVNLSQSAYSVLLIPVIGLVGRLLYPLFYQLCKSREHRVSRVAFLVCVLASCILCFNRVPLIPGIVALSIVYAAVSIVNTSFLAIYPMNFSESGNVASVSGALDFCTYLGTGAASVIYGVVIHNWGYLPMFLSWIGASIVSVIFLYILERRASVKL